MAGCGTGRSPGRALIAVRPLFLSRAKHRDAKTWPQAIARVALCISAMASPAVALAATQWPSLQLPASLHTFSMGSQIMLNGLPLQMVGFVSDLPPLKIVEQFRGTLGQPLVENTIGQKIVLGRMEPGKFYVTVQVEAAPSGSRGVVAITDLAELAQSRDARISSRVRWIDRLPSGSTIASQMTSAERGKSTLHLVYTNAHTVQANRDALARMMTADGYRIERQTDSISQHRDDRIPPGTDGDTIYFTGSGKDGIAVIAKRGTNTSIVLNTVVALKEFR